ncbi:MAG: twin-arginine translocation signal domain-containing protein, partial [Lentisphaerae bacterium]
MEKDDTGMKRRDFLRLATATGALAASGKLSGEASEAPRPQGKSGILTGNN